MRRELDPAEKRRLQGERERIERADFPNVEIEVIVDDYTYANGELVARVVSRGVKPNRPKQPVRAAKVCFVR